MNSDNRDDEYVRRHLYRAQYYTGRSAARRRIPRTRARRYFGTSKLAGFLQPFFASRKRTIMTLVGILVVPIVLIQLFYPGWFVLPNTTVGSVVLGAESKKKAAKDLDTAYAAAKVPIYFSDSDEVVIEPTLGDLGITTDNQARVNSYSYPFWARLVPYSLFWYQAFIKKGEPMSTKNDATLASYISSHFGDDCEFQPSNASIAYTSGSLQVVPATRGGSCDPAEMLGKLQGVAARLDPDRITINGTSTSPDVSTATAQTEYNRLVKQLGGGVTLKVEKNTNTIPKDTVAQWIEYTANGNSLQLSLNNDKATQWLNDTYGKKYTTSAGTTVVNVVDYAEKSRTSGAVGTSLDIDATISDITKDLLGQQQTATLAINTIQPTVQYNRSFSPSDQAISNVIQQYAASHPGSYGVKMVELSGARRNASYNSSQIFTTASTYKLFVAYSILLRIERGDVSWDDSSYGGYSVSTCFDRMIELSDNDCALSLLKIAGGYTAVQTDARALGDDDTTFDTDTGTISSDADDESNFLSLLYTGQLLSQQSSRDRLISAMKGNVYVAGIPTGIPNATIADKVGFLDGLLHDAAIVYSQTGDYVLVIMTNNASWSNIAELAGQIEAARNS